MSPPPPRPQRRSVTIVATWSVLAVATVAGPSVGSGLAAPDTADHRAAPVAAPAVHRTTTDRPPVSSAPVPARAGAPDAPATTEPDAVRRPLERRRGPAATDPSEPMRPDAGPDEATTQRRRRRARPEPVVDPLGPLASPDVGDHCASGLGAAGMTELFSRPIGAFQGADYQRALRLPDDRVLWTFQDAFVGGTLVHNVGMVQSGKCFTMLGDGPRSWLLGERTSHMRRWHWILDGAVGVGGSTVHLFVVQMDETGPHYLSRTRPTALRRVVLDATTLQVRDVVDEAPAGDDLYGWSVTSDGEFTYLYSHCYRQFGYDTLFGFAECAAAVKLARVPLGRLGAPREYWDGNGWSAERERAVPVVDGTFVVSGNNPAQVRFDGERFVLVEKRDDWWGETVEFGVARRPQGPFRHVASIDEPLKCDRSVCNTYFASWVPWRDAQGRSIWSIGHNRWDGSTTHLHLDTYRPTFHTVDP